MQHEPVTRPRMATAAIRFIGVLTGVGVLLTLSSIGIRGSESTGTHWGLVATFAVPTVACGLVTFGLSMRARWAWVTGAALLGLIGGYVATTALTSWIMTLRGDNYFPPVAFAGSVAVTLPIVGAATALSFDAVSQWFARPMPHRDGSAQWLVIVTGLSTVATVGSTAFMAWMQLQDAKSQLWAKQMPMAPQLVTTHYAGIALAIVALMAVVQLLRRRPGGQFGVMTMCAASAMYPFWSAHLLNSAAPTPVALMLPALGFVLAATLDLSPVRPAAAH